MSSQPFVGIDVSKATLDVAVCPSQPGHSFPHDEAGLAHLVAYLRELAPALVVLEATGGYETDVAAALAVAAVPLAVVNPRQVRDFAKAIGRLAKTDALDAEVLALFAERIRPVAQTLPDEAQQDLAALITRRRQLVDMLGAERNRLGLARPALRAQLRTHIRWLEQRLRDVDHDLAARIQASPLWRVTDNLLQSVPGVGPATAHMLIAALPELGQLSRQAIASLVGVAPFNCDSGALRGTRRIWGGRAPVRHALYMATLVATRFNPAIRTFYQRLLGHGKPRRLALIAAMRKLLTILNAMLKHQQPWQPSTR
jgi:transposase